MKHQDYLDVATSRDKETFERRLVAFAQKLDFGIVSAALVVERPAQTPLFLTIGNTPQAFLEASRNVEDALRDPVLKRLKTLSHPFAYDQAMYVHDDAGDLWEEQAQFGYRTGISMALHMSGGRHFLLGVDRELQLPQEDAVMTRLMADLQLLAVFAQETAVRVLLPVADEIEPVPLLSARELEILQWTRDGKSTWVISQLLSLSEGTVNYHLRAAATKLKVSGKHQAVLKAISLRIL